MSVSGINEKESSGGGGHEEFSRLEYLWWKDPPLVWVVPSGGSPDEGDWKRKYCLLPACPLLLMAAPAAFLHSCMTSFSSLLTKSEGQQLSGRASGLQGKTGNETSSFVDQETPGFSALYCETVTLGLARLYYISWSIRPP